MKRLCGKSRTSSRPTSARASRQGTPIYLKYDSIRRDCLSTGSGSGCNSLQLGRIYMDMLNVYKVTSVNIDTAIKNCGESATRQPLIKLMRGVKKDTLKLIASLVQRADDANMVLDLQYLSLDKSRIPDSFWNLFLIKFLLDD